MKKLFYSRYTDNSISLALLILRLALGGLMIPHGFDKLQNFSTQSAGFPDPFHIGPQVSMGLTIFAEFFCAILLVVGLLTRLACIPLLVAMGVAVFKAHQGQIFGDGEHAALYLFGYFALLVAGPGKFSADRMIGK